MHLIKVCLYLSLFGVVSFASCKEDDVEPLEDPIESEIPATLRGEWLESWSLYMQHSFDPMLYDPQSNTWFRGSYDPWSMDPVPGFGIQLNRDGTFVWAMVVATSTGGCQVYTAEYLKGTVSLENDIITFKPQIRRMKYHSVCNPTNDFDRSEDNASFTMQYKLSTVNDSGGQFELLALTSPDGSQIQYARKKS